MKKRTNWDEHLSTILFSYRTSYKVVIGYTPYQLVYSLHPLMPIEYVLSTINGDHIDVGPTKVLIAKVIELGNL
jgi:hypothetical protein